jgi:hypothetical protein
MYYLIWTTNFTNFCSIFLRWNRTSSNTNTNTNTSSNSPMLLCLGDSLTHGSCSASFTPEIPLQLSQKLCLPLSEHPHRSFADPLWVVNAGQNSITSHTVLQERLAPTLQAIYPDYVLILIGTMTCRPCSFPKRGGNTYRTSIDYPPYRHCRVIKTMYNYGTGTNCDTYLYIYISTYFFFTCS